MKKKSFIWTFAMLLLFGMTSCSDDNDNNSGDDTDKHHFVFINNVDMSSYIGTFKDLTIGNLNNKDAYEITIGNYAFTYGNTILVSFGTQGDLIIKYTRDEQTGQITETGRLTVPSASDASHIVFYDEKTAYVTLEALGIIWKINYQTMQKESEIDLTQYAVGDNNPDPGTSIIRDGKLFVALMQKRTMQTAYESAYVAVIDIATNQVDKIITDDRTTSIGATNDMNTHVFMDENEDIYFYSAALMGAQEGAKDGFLRIKKGETEWDDDFFLSVANMSITDVPDNKADYAFGLLYDKNGNVYCNVMIPSWTSNPPDYVNDRNCQPVVINIWNKTAQKLPLPSTAAWTVFTKTKWDNEIIYGLSTSSAIGFYSYNTNTSQGSTTPLITVEGLPYFIEGYK